MLSVEDVAAHFRLRSDTVRRKIRSKEIHAIRMGRVYRLDWKDVWMAEAGPMPRRSREDRYKEPLISKRQIAGSLRVSIRTVEHWMAGGLPTRNVFGAVRFSPHDVTDWLRLMIGSDLPDRWWTR